MEQDTQTTGKPIRFFHGTADDWNPIAPCRDYVKRLKSAGADVTLTELPDGMHVFDDAALNPPLSLPNAFTLGSRVIEEGDNGVLLNAKTGNTFKLPGDPCIEKGTHIGYNAAAHKAAIEGVTQFLKTTFKLQ